MPVGLDGPVLMAGRRAKGTLGLLLAFVAVIAAVEGAARLVALRLGDAGGWNDPGLAAQARRMGEVAENQGGAELVVLGSSATGEGIDPERLAQASQAYDSAYNAWHAGAPARSLDLLARSLILPLLHPEVVVIGLASEQLNDNGSGHFSHEALESSPARPLVPEDGSAAERIVRPMADWSYFVRLRETLRRPSDLVDALRAGPDNNPYEINARGMSTSNLAQELSLTPRHLEQNREALADYELGAVELPAFRRLVQRLRSDGIRVLIVNMPVLEDVYLQLHPRGAMDNDRYEAALEALTREAGLAYLDTTVEPWGPEWFADENHVNGMGSARVTDLVAREVDRLVPSSAGPLRDQDGTR